MRAIFPRLLGWLTLALMAISVAGCGIVYRLPVRQGNVIKQSKLDKLHLGMTPAQVRYVMGTPLASSPFDADRWEYLSYYKSQHGSISSRKVSLLFQNGKLTDMVGIDNAEAARKNQAADAADLKHQQEAAQHELKRGGPKGPGAAPHAPGGGTGPGSGGPLIGAPR